MTPVQRAVVWTRCSGTPERTAFRREHIVPTNGVYRSGIVARDLRPDRCAVASAP